MPFLNTLAPEDLLGRLQRRVALELDHDVRQQLHRRDPLTQALDLQIMRRYARQATGEKFLLTPQR